MNDCKRCTKITVFVLDVNNKQTVNKLWKNDAFRMLYLIY